MKKVLSFILSTVMLVTLIIPASATETNVSDDIEAIIASEIQCEQERIFASVYAQLEQQNATELMDIYMEILTPKIEAAVYSDHGLSTTATRASKTYTLRNGGSIGYNSISDSVVLDVYFTDDQFRVYQNEHAGVLSGAISFSISSVLTFLFNRSKLDQDYAHAISGWGFIYNVLLLGKSTADTYAQTSVNNADGYAEIINVSATGGSSTGSVIIGWSNHPRVIVPDTASNINLEPF